MAESIISPGVYARENDISFIQPAPVAAGAAFIGPTIKGPVNQPLVVTSYSDYVRKFGETFTSASSTYEFQTSIAVKSYFQQGGQTALVTRVVSGSYTAATATNIVTNPSYEDSTTNWSLGTGFTRVSTDSHDGSYSILLLKTSGYEDIHSSSGYAVSSTDLCTVSYWYKRPSVGQSGDAPLLEINAGSAYGYNLLSAYLTDTSGSWYNYTTTLNPTTTQTWYIRLLNHGGSSTAYIDDWDIDCATPTVTATSTATSTDIIALSFISLNTLLYFITGLMICVWIWRLFIV